MTHSIYHVCANKPQTPFLKCPQYRYTIPWFFLRLLFLYLPCVFLLWPKESRAATTAAICNEFNKDPADPRRFSQRAEEFQVSQVSSVFLNAVGDCSELERWVERVDQFEVVYCSMLWCSWSSEWCSRSMAHCTAALRQGAQAPRLQKHSVLQTWRLKSCQTMSAVCKRIVSAGTLESLSKYMRLKGDNIFSNRVRRIVFLGCTLAFCPDNRTRLHAKLNTGRFPNICKHFF